MKNISAYFAVAALLVAGCAENPVSEIGAGDEMPVRIVVSVDGLTRAGGDSFMDGDKLGLYAFRHKDDPEEAFKGVRQMDNLLLTVSGGQAQGESPIYFPKYDDNTDFYMYYPYENVVIEPSSTYQFSYVYSDQSTDENYRLSDKMLGVSLNVEKSPAPVHFRMKRLMSKVSFRLKPGTGYGSCSEILSAQVLLKNIKNTAAIGCISGSMTDPYTPDDIIPHGTFSENYSESVAEGVEAVIIPQKIETGSVMFVVSIGDRKFNGVLENDVTFEAGKHYTFTMTVNRVINGDAVTVQPEITDWTEGLVADGGVIEVDPDDDANFVTDIDGNEYRIVRLGTQKWMGENLRVTRFNDGTPIKNITDQTEWDNSEQGEVAGYCYYDNDPANAAKYGALYNWYAVAPGNICPEGWHVPDVDDFKTLISFLGENAGTKIKSVDGWYDVDGETKPEYQGTDEYGFSAIPCGNRRYQEGYQRKDMYGEWWTSDLHEQYTTSAYIYFVYAKYNDIRSLYHLKETGHAIRCVKD